MTFYKRNEMRVKTLLSLAVLLTTATAAIAAGPAIDPTLPVYQRANQLNGKITMIGSDTISQVAAVWADGFRKLYPDVEIEIQVKGSVSAIPSVIDGDATFGLLSRQPTSEEIKAFYTQFGYPPTVLTPAHESLGVYVHKENPVESVSPAQLRAIFAANPAKGTPTIKTWGELGATGQWANQPILANGRSDTTGSQVFFQNMVLGGGEFRADLKSQPNNLELVRAIRDNPRGIGFVGTNYEIPEVKALSLVYQPGAQPVGVHTPGYPLIRPLELVVNKNPQKDLPLLQQEFLKYVFSSSGQQSVVISGFSPVPSPAARSARAAAGLKSLN